MNLKAAEAVAKRLAACHPGREATETDLIRWGEQVDIAMQRLRIETNEDMDTFDNLIASFM